MVVSDNAVQPTSDTQRNLDKAIVEYKDLYLGVIVDIYPSFFDIPEEDIGDHHEWLLSSSVTYNMSDLKESWVIIELLSSGEYVYSPIKETQVTSYM